MNTVAKIYLFDKILLYFHSTLFEKKHLMNLYLLFPGKLLHLLICSWSFIILERVNTQHRLKLINQLYHNKIKMSH